MFLKNDNRTGDSNVKYMNCYIKEVKPVKLGEPVKQQLI